MIPAANSRLSTCLVKPWCICASPLLTQVKHNTESQRLQYVTSTERIRQIAWTLWHLADRGAPIDNIVTGVSWVFKKFDQLGSIRQTHRWFHEQGVELPVNKTLAGQRQLYWQLPTVSFISNVLHNPLYAGVYTWGRRPTEVTVKDGRTIKRSGEHSTCRRRQCVPARSPCGLYWP